MNVKSPEAVLRKPVATWLSASDYAKFEAVARSHGITMAAYLRSIVIDAIIDDAPKAMRTPMRSPKRLHAVAG